MGLVEHIKDGDWRSVRSALAKLASLKLGPTAKPTFAGLTLIGFTASRLVATDSNKKLVSSDLINWVTGTTNRVTVSADDDPAGGIILTGPQDIHTGATPTFAGLTVDTDTLIVDAVNHTVEPKIVELVTTTSSLTGVIRKGTNRFIHDFHHPTGEGAIPTGENTFIGVNAGNFAMGSTATQTYHASYNNAMGYASLYSNTTGYYNSAIGSGSLFTNTTGYQNNAVGTFSLYSNTTGYQNSAIGSESGHLLTTGLANIFLGYNAGYRQTTNDNLLIIDNQRRADTATEQTNAIFYGVMAAAPASQTLRINASTLVTNKIAFTQTDLNEYIDSLADGYMDYGATTAHRFNNNIDMRKTSVQGYIFAYDTTLADYTMIYHDGANAYLQTNAGHIVLAPQAGNYVVISGAGLIPSTDGLVLGITGVEFGTAYINQILSDTGTVDFGNENLDTTGVYKVSGTQVIGAKVIDARCDDALNSGDATTDGVIDALRDAMITHGLIAAA